MKDELLTLMHHTIESVKKTAAELELLLKGAKAILVEKDFETTAKRLFYYLREALGAEAGYVALLSDDGNFNELLFLESGHMICTVDPNAPMPIRGMREEAYRLGQSVYHNDFSNTEWYSLLPDGHVKLHNVMFCPLNIEGKSVGVLGLANKPEGFTERDARLGEAFGDLAAVALINVRTREALKRQRDEAQLYFDFASVMLLVLDKEGNITKINKRGWEILEVESESVIGLNWFENFMPEGKQEHLEDIFKKILDGDKANNYVEEQVITKKGNIRTLAWQNKVLKDLEGNIIGVLRSGEDITEIIHAKEKQQRLERLESLGVLAGGIAHDFNNVLTGIVGNINMAKMKLSPDSESEEFLVKAENASFKATMLTKQLLTFSKGGAPLKSETSITQLLRSEATLVLKDTAIKCHFEIYPDLPPVEIDKDQIAQVIQNVVTNAVQSMSNVGILKISAQNTTKEEKDLSKMSMPADHFIKISVQDEGHGIPEDVLPRIFDPYFTTKESSRGLGLSVVYSIISNHQGYIEVDSIPGTGTEFNIYLPVKKTKSSEIKAKKALSQKEIRVLVMDDEAIIRDVLGEMLGTLNYRVKFANDGTEAIRQYQATYGSYDAFDVVILDLTINGGMGGVETLTRLREINPDVKAIVASGYSNDSVLSDYETYGFKSVITKPFNLDTLKLVLETALTS